MATLDECPAAANQQIHPVQLEDLVLAEFPRGASLRATSHTLEANAGHITGSVNEEPLQRVASIPEKLNDATDHYACIWSFMGTGCG